MPRPIRPEAADGLGAYRNDTASYLSSEARRFIETTGEGAEAVTRLSAAAAALTDADLTATIAQFAEDRRAVSAELAADGVAAEGFDAVMASLRELRTAETQLVAAATGRAERAASLLEMQADATVVTIPGTTQLVAATNATAVGAETSNATGGTDTFVTNEAAEALRNVREGAAGSQIAASTTTPDEGDSEIEGDEMPVAVYQASVAFMDGRGGAHAFGTQIDESVVTDALAASLSAAQGLGSVGGRVQAFTVDRHSHVNRATDVLQLQSGSEVHNGEIIARRLSEHRETRALRAAMASKPGARRFSDIVPAEQVQSAAALCVQGRIEYDVRICSSRGTPFQDCMFVDVASERGSLTTFFGEHYSRSATPPAAFTTDCPDGTPSNKVCFVLDGCPTPATSTLCAYATCVKVGTFSKMNHPEMLRNLLHNLYVADDVNHETRALNWVRAQTIVQVATPWYGADTTVYANVTRALLGLVSDRRLNGQGTTYDLAMPWWFPYLLLVNDQGAGKDRGHGWTSLGEVESWMRNLIPNLGSICTYWDTPTTGPSQLWQPSVAGPVQKFPAIPEIMLIPEGLAGRLTAPGITMGSSLEDAKMFGDDDRQGNCLSIFAERFYAYHKMHDCGQAITLQFPGLCANGSYAAAAALACGNSV